MSFPLHETATRSYPALPDPLFPERYLMKSNCFLVFSITMASALFASLPAAAGTGLVIGTHVTPSELSALGTTGQYNVGGSALNVLPAEKGVTAKSTEGPSTTTVVNDKGVVGVSRNEVLIAQVSTQVVRSQGSALLAAAKTVTYYDTMQITSVRYGTFADAVTGREKLQTMFPKAQVTLPIEYHQRKPR